MGDAAIAASPIFVILESLAVLDSLAVLVGASDVSLDHSS
jgi:hypothetical protein